MTTRVPWRIRAWHWFVGCPAGALEEIGHWGMLVRCRICRRSHWRI